jgi:hypothetical protein
MKMPKIILNITGLFALVFAVNCSQTTLNGQNKDSISSSFMESCNPNDDKSMQSVCNCAESKFREEDEESSDPFNAGGSGTTTIRGVSRSEMDTAITECRQ